MLFNKEGTNLKQHVDLRKKNDQDSYLLPLENTVINGPSIVLQSLKSHILLINDRHNVSTIKGTNYFICWSYLIIKRQFYIRGCVYNADENTMEKNAGVFVTSLS